MQIAPTAAPTATAFPKAQLIVHVSVSINMNISWTAREWESPLQHGINCPFVNPVSLSTFLNTRTPLRDLPLMMSSPLHVFGGLGSANRGQARVDEHMKTS